MPARQVLVSYKNRKIFVLESCKNFCRWIHSVKPVQKWPLHSFTFGLMRAMLIPPIYLDFLGWLEVIPIGTWLLYDTWAQQTRQRGGCSPFAPVHALRASSRGSGVGARGRLHPAERRRIPQQRGGVGLLRAINSLQRVLTIARDLAYCTCPTEKALLQLKHKVLSHWDCSAEAHATLTRHCYGPDV